MKADPKGVLTGEHYLDGDHACSEGAIAAGCRFLGGYPITPSTEVAERISERFPEVGGIFIQMEDEMGSMAAVVGATWGGVKALTVTSGPGFSLMQENIGLAVMLETPCVVINVQRGGPSTGLPTLPGQADMMQARWGSHGDYEIIAVSPNSPQDCFEQVIKAVNLSEKYRVPVMVMTDECVGHMTEKVVIPPADEIELYPRRYTKLPPEEYLPFKAGKDMIPEMVKAGDGYKIHVTGLTHDEKGYPVMNWEVQEKLVRRLVEKIRLHADELEDIEETQMEDAEVVIFSYGISSRVCIPALQKARGEGLKVGLLRPIICWPFPEKKIRELAGKVKAIVVVEMNYGQLFYEVERCACGKSKVSLVPHGGGWVHDPEDIYNAIKEAVK
ncbi:MAG: 2-oxoacid:acceptor oxidoreductase subunit alpha [Candidatus Zixiibacteriota bacterium]